MNAAVAGWLAAPAHHAHTRPGIPSGLTVLLLTAGLCPFALLVAVASVQITAEGPKKKIRIHLPQKVKHIHHHKKIYITNHQAPSQYAPAFLPGVKGAVALPSNVARPAVASIVPLNSVELYDETRPRLQGVSPAASKLLPLYRARGHYGPNHSDWDEQEYDLSPPPEPTDIYGPSGYSAPSAPGPSIQPTSPTKKIKLVKVTDAPRKKVIRKVKPKRVIVRGRPQPPAQPLSEDEHPVSSFHEQFYSDLEEAGTIRKIKKPPRIEKIIDGDTEHIHTYSEEHIHKVVFDDEPKVTGVVGVDPIGSMSALNAAHPLIPIKNAQTLVAIPTDSFADLAVMGSMGTPSHLEFASYNPREVTHDHIFHDHGEIPPGVDITKEGLRLPPKVTYDKHGLRITNDHSKRHQGKRYGKPTKPNHDFTYYESLFATPNQRPKKVPKPTHPTPYYDGSSESNINNFRPIPAFRFKDSKRKTKARHYGYKPLPNFQLKQASVPAPFAVSSTIVHEYDPKNYGGTGPAPTGFSKFRDPLIDFKDSYSSDFDYDTFASSSNIHTSEDKTDGKGKKSVSTQNISFGGQDRQTYVDHLEGSASNNAAVSISDEAPTALEGSFTNFDQTTDSATPTPYTIKETSPAHQYYTAMALKALHSEQPDVSNDDMQYESPTPSSDPTESPVATTTPSQTLHFYKIQSTDAIPEPEYITETRLGKRRREKNKGEHRQRYNAVFKELVAGYQNGEQPPHTHGLRQAENKYFRTTDSSSVRESPKYGDKI
ncbi:uncharacterized protein LOC126380423 [Pectinophora gossypiella]|uniref:uncharacterized protein LOC126380423 n=1 Tax=Pectinophora gossypiella TaxID=13191 RepID=UPI00214E4052|nr:uncharacterized protein LOC126380423 [Pectinophora gossypiella]